MEHRSLKAKHSGILMISLLAVAFLTASCKTYQVESRWTAEPVQVDGQMSEWSDVPLTYIEKSNVQLALRNDEENLYVLFCFYDAK